MTGQQRMELLRARRAFLVLTGLRWFHVAQVVPVFVLVPTSRGLSLAELGVGLAVYSTTVGILELPTGGLADLVGRRTVLTVSAATTVSAYAVFLLAGDLAGFALAFVLLGASRALDSGPLESWFVDRALQLDPDFEPEDDLGRAETVVNGALAVGSISGVLVGTLVGGRVGGLAPIDWPVAVALGLAVVQLVAVRALMVEPVVVDRPTWRQALLGAPAQVLASGRLGWRDRGIRLVLVAEAMWGLGFVTVEYLWQPRVAELLPRVLDDPILLGVMNGAAFAAGAVGAWLVTGLRRRLGGRTDLAAMVVRLVEAGALLGLVAAGGLLAFLPLWLLAYAGNGATSPMHMAMLHRRVDPGRRATIVSVNSLAGMAGALVCSLTLVPLAEARGFGAAWALGAVALAVGAACYPLAARHPAPVAAEASAGI